MCHYQYMSVDAAPHGVLQMQSIYSTNSATIVMRATRDVGEVS